jgi:hypothetical protein
LVDSVFVSWILTITFAVTGLWFLLGGGRTGWLTDGVHAVGSAAMIAMIWPWGARVPAWPQVVAFTVAAGWFLTRVVRSTRQNRSWWSPAHHAIMAGALVWMIVMMPETTSMEASMPQPGGDDAMGSAMSSGGSGAVGAVSVVIAAYFLVATWPWVSAAIGTFRPGGDHEPVLRRRRLDSASHALMSLGMAALLVIMA